MSDDERRIRRTVRELVLGMAPETDPVGDDPDLVDELGYYSLALLELAFALEDEFDLPPIDQDSARRIHTVSDVADYVVAQLRSRKDAVSG